MILACQNISKSFGVEPVIRNVSFHVEDQEKVAIVGINGAGKSTLLKIIVGELPADEGTVTLAKGKTLGYLAQHQDMDDARTIYETVLEGKRQLIDMEQKIRELEEGMQSVSKEEMESYMESYHKLLHEFEARDGYSYRSEVSGVLKGLGFSENDFEKHCNELSGGQKTRVSLARLLVTHPDIILLDEPTNHLDHAMAAWLEDYLKRWRGSLIMVTHDRYFLDSVSNRIAEIDKGKIYSYDTNYSGFLELKAQREEMEAATERKRQSILRVELEWVKRGARARSTKQKARLERYEEMKNQHGPQSDGQVSMSSITTRMGNTTIEIDGISKSYGGHMFIRDFSYIFLKNDRVGFVGTNGCGKTTLMKLLAGREEPDSGSIKVGQTIRIGYYSQEIETSKEAGIAYMDPKMRVIDYIRETAEFVRTEDGLISASAMLERFLFPPQAQYSLIGKLSGGERRRLNLLRVLMESPNVLILDEPTNDLDIQTLTILEDYLDHFDGIIITVSHDRYFLDRIVNRIFSFEGDGKVRQFEGGYSDYLIRKELEGLDTEMSPKGHAAATEGQSKKGESSSKDTWKQRKPKFKFTYKEQREFETIDDDIAKLEEKLETLDAQIAANATNSVKLRELMDKKEEAGNELDEKMERWVYLNDLNEKIQNADITKE